MIFHLITEGECYVEMDGEPPVRLIAGDAVIFPEGDAHRMTSQPGLPPATGARLDQVLARRPRQLVYGGGGPTTRLVCGYLACDARLAGMLLAGLPALCAGFNVRQVPTPVFGSKPLFGTRFGPKLARHVPAARAY